MRSIKHILAKNVLLLRRNPQPIVFMILLIIILFPLTSIYENLESWEIRVGVVNEDTGYDGIRYSVFLLSEMDIDEVNYKSMGEAVDAGERGVVDAVIYIQSNFSKIIYEISQGNTSAMGNATLMSILIFSNYPQIKAALAAKLKAIYEKFISSGENGMVEYRDMSNYKEFSYYSTSMLISFIFTFYYSLLFLFKDSKGPFFWLYFRRKEGFLSLLLSNTIFFLIISISISLALLPLYHYPVSFFSVLIPISLITLGSIALSFFTSTFVRRESHIYYISPILILLGIIATGVLGPEKYMPIYLKIIYEAFPVSIEFFYNSLYHISRALLLSAGMLLYSFYFYLLRE